MRLLIALVAVACLSGCGSSSTPAPVTPPPPPPTGQLTVTWAPPKQNTDGTPITGLAGFRIYHDGLVLTVSATTLAAVLANLALGKHSLVVTAFNTYGEESSRTCAGSGTVT